MSETATALDALPMIRVISMAGVNARREAFAKSADDAGIAWSFFDALTSVPPFLVNDPVKQRAAMLRELLPAELGCYASHASVWREFLASDARSLLVLEDDVVVDWGFVRLLLQHDFKAMNIHYLKLFDKVPVRRKVIASPFLNRYYHLVQNLNTPFGAQAYLLTRSGAERMLNNALTIRRPIDSELDNFWVHNVPCLSVVPSPLFERCSISTIGDDRFLLAPTAYVFLVKIFNFVRRLMFTWLSRSSHVSVFRMNSRISTGAYRAPKTTI